MVAGRDGQGEVGIHRVAVAAGHDAVPLAMIAQVALDFTGRSDPGRICALDANQEMN
ncbi:hypothetical protein CNECB9_1450008 [Cupriavidus necator]|uniref:Uncharacterized protein n=1 Tax=Cupriavidus necator TaxID=106590 RepID=A0A1K0I9L4_CUPNE|nr:hypothetical protein CNECB9_1450008 [Cupriavidus necator]